MKTCPCCQDLLPLDAFYRKGDKRQTYCKKCQWLKIKAWRERNRAQFNAKRRKKRA